MVSMKDIANKCGVSVATVSKALNDQSDIGTETRERVVKAATELGYMTNAAARALKTSKTYNLGILFVDEQSSGLTHDFFAEVMNSFKVEAEKLGYDVTFISRNIGKKPTSYLQHSLYRGVDGVVIACIDFYDPQVAELVESGIPVVTIDHTFEGHAAIMSNNVEGIETLVKYAVSKGHKKIAYIHGESCAVTSVRIKGFYRACEALGINVPEEYLVLGEYNNPERFSGQIQQLMSIENPPTCVLGPDDFSTIGGYMVPGLLDRVSLLGYDGVRLSGIIRPMLTTYRQDTEAMGRLAADKLVELIEHPRTALAERIIVPGYFVEGDTVHEV